MNKGTGKIFHKSEFKYQSGMPQRPNMNGDTYDRKPFDELDPTVKFGLHAGKQ